MPYENEHACRLVEPSKCMDGDDNWGRVSRKSKSHNGKSYDVIRGRLKTTGEWIDQAFRYPIESWDIDEARSH